MGENAVTREERIDLRTTREVKESIQRAAEHLGTSMSAFIVHHAYEAARALLQERQAVVLSDRDRDRFLELLDHPPKPNAALKRLMESPRRRQG